MPKLANRADLLFVLKSPSDDSCAEPGISDTRLARKILAVPTTKIFRVIGVDASEPAPDRWSEELYHQGPQAPQIPEPKEVNDRDYAEGPAANASAAA